LQTRIGKIACNHLDVKATPFGRSLNKETGEARYGKAVAQFTVRTRPRKIQIRLDLGLLKPITRDL
jgi:hypothetical protein